MTRRHICSHCRRPNDGLTSDQVFAVLTRDTSPAALVFRGPLLRKLAHRIGACECTSHAVVEPPPIPADARVPRPARAATPQPALESTPEFTAASGLAPTPGSVRPHAAASSRVPFIHALGLVKLFASEPGTDEPKEARPDWLTALLDDGLVSGAY